MRKLFAILTMLAALMLASVTAFAAPSLVDNAKVLTPQQRQEVLAELHKQEQAHNVRIAVVTMKTIGGAVPGEYAAPWRQCGRRYRPGISRQRARGNPGQYESKSHG